jgi:hypothetical protein
LKNVIFHKRFVNFCDLVQVKMVFLQWIPWLLRMSRPGDKLSLKSILMHRQMQEMDSKVWENR